MTNRDDLSLLGAPARYSGGLADLGDGVRAWVQPNGEVGESNAGLIVGSGESLLVDTLWDLQLTGRMLQAMHPWTATAPIRRLANTHADGDHCWGNQLLPEAEKIATAAAEQDLRADAPGGWRALAGLGRLLRPLAKVRRPVPGLTTAAAVAAMAGTLSGYDFRGIVLTPPTRTFRDTLTIEVGGRRVDLLELGPAHTPGDAVVHVPDAAVVFAGDLVFTGVAPIMWAGPVENWIAALDRILELAPRVVVPGHGPVGGLDAVHAMRDYWTYIAGAVRRELADGRDPTTAAVRIVHSDEFARQPFADWLGHERLLVTAHILARNDQGGRGRVPPLTRLRLLIRLATLAADLGRMSPQQR